MRLIDFVQNLSRAQNRAASPSTPVEVYHANTGERFDIVSIYTDTDDDRGPLVCIDVEPAE